MATLSLSIVDMTDMHYVYSIVMTKYVILILRPVSPLDHLLLNALIANPDSIC